MGLISVDGKANMLCWTGRTPHCRCTFSKWNVLRNSQTVVCQCKDQCTHSSNERRSRTLVVKLSIVLSITPIKVVGVFKSMLRSRCGWGIRVKWLVKQLGLCATPKRCVCRMKALPAFETNRFNVKGYIRLKQRMRT